MEFLNFQQPENQIPESGKLLIAAPFLNDPNFSRTVILLAEHSSEGTIGFVLNHDTQLNLDKLLPEFVNSTIAVYQGGPVQVDTLQILHRIPSVLGGNDIGNAVYWGGSFEVLQDIIIDDTYQSKDVKLCIGYSGWEVGQLERELKEGSWIVTDATPRLIFDTEGKDLWKEAIKSLGGQYAYLANMPLNPQYN